MLGPASFLVRLADEAGRGLKLGLRDGGFRKGKVRLADEAGRGLKRSDIEHVMCFKRFASLTKRGVG